MAVVGARPVAIKIDEEIKARVKRLADARQADQADAWLTRLEQGDDVDPPACRS